MYGVESTPGVAVLRGRIAWWLDSDRVWRAYHATGVAEVGK